MSSEERHYNKVIGAVGSIAPERHRRLLCRLSEYLDKVKGDLLTVTMFTAFPGRDRRDGKCVERCSLIRF